EALALVDKNGERYWEAELYRRKGELLLQSGVWGVEQEAEVCFQQALAVAHRQQAKALELRAVLSLSRLWHQQGTWLQAEEVVKINSFWRDIKGLVESDVVHCLFAVRLDPEVVLPSIDFT